LAAFRSKLKSYKNSGWTADSLIQNGVKKLLIAAAFMPPNIFVIPFPLYTFLYCTLISLPPKENEKDQMTSCLRTVLSILQGGWFMSNVLYM
jgi:hypothetical protein